MSENSNLTNILAELGDDENLQPISQLIEQVMAIPEENLNESSVEMISGMMAGAMTPKIRREAKQNISTNFENENYSRAQAVALVDGMKHEFSEMIDSIKPSDNKRKILNNIFSDFYSLFDEVIEKYHNYNFELPIKLDEGAKMPTYAHETDAAADLYAADDMVLAPHSLSNMVRTGVHIRLPEGWCAFVVPRSSIGAKTGLRLSNSQGVIDNDYTGPIGVLYDNISDSPYSIKAGDRIAQIYVMPTYHFKGIEVNNLETTERGEGGFGSSGK